MQKKDFVRLVLGVVGGLLFVVVAVLCGMFTGLIGFYMSSSRLMFGMARAKMLPKWFAYIHPTYKTPTHAILFVMVLATIVPFIGREVLNWFVDMAAVGTGFGYFFTCAGAYVVLTKGIKPKSDDDISPAVAAAGAIISAGIVGLQVIPGMPAFLSVPCWAALGIWVTMGVIFYFVAAGDFRKLSPAMVGYLITGEKHGLTKAELESIEGCTPTTVCDPE